MDSLLLLLLVQLVRSEPTLSFPFNAQLPPVARIDQFFSYALSPHTFQSHSNITYSLANPPTWLSIEPGGRLYGTPMDHDLPPGDVVGQTVGIVATDGGGFTTANATLVVSRNKGPSVQIPITRQIESFGPFSAPSSLLSYPSAEFEYSFDPDTFSTPHSLNYYAISNDSSPLPSWLKFDADSLTFSGKTPAFETLVQPPQTFDVSLVASDIVGFSAASISFSIVVGSHKLTTERPIIQLNVTRGDTLSYDNLEDGIKLDGKPVKPGYLDVSADGMPLWLVYNADKGKLEGTPKGNDHSTNFTINFSDAFQDTLRVLVQVNVSTGLFQTTFQDVKAQPGGTFSLDLTSYFRDPQDIELKIKSTPEEDWLQTDGFKLSGRVPQSAKGDFNVTVDATSMSTGLKETENIFVVFLAADGTTIESTPSSAGKPAQKPTTTGHAKTQMSNGKPHSRHLTAGQIVMATLIPLFFVALGISLLLCFTRRQHWRLRLVQGQKRLHFAERVLGTLRTIGPVPASQHGLRRIAAMRQLRPFKMPLFKSKNEPATDEDTASSVSERPGSSQTLEGLSVLKAPPAILASDSRSATVKSVRTQREIERDSWVTVEDGVSVSRSQRSVRTRDSDVELAEGMQRQCLPVDGTDLAMEYSLDGLSNIQPLPLALHKSTTERKSTGGHSIQTSSSAALPESYFGSQWLFPRILGKKPIRRAEEEEGEVFRLPQPERRLSSHQAWNSCPALARVRRESLMDSNRQSMMTVSSFESTENWRVIGRQDTPRSLMRYDTLRDVAGSERPSMELMSPSKWGEDEGVRRLKREKEDKADGDKEGRPPRMVRKSGSEVNVEGATAGEGRAAAKAIMRALGEDTGEFSEGSFRLFM